MGSLGPFEIIIIAVVLLLFFGAKRLPELARGIGKSLKEFKKATSDIQDEIENSTSSNSKKHIDQNNNYDQYDKEQSKQTKYKDEDKKANDKQE